MIKFRNCKKKYFYAYAYGYEDTELYFKVAEKFYFKENVFPLHCVM